MIGLTTPDFVAICLYFIVNLLIGVWAMRRVRNQEDFFLGGRRFGKIIQTFAAFGQATSAENVVSVTTTTMRNGASGIWSNLLALFSTPVYWITSPWYRRMRVITMGDFFAERYESKSLAAVYALTQTAFLMIAIALSFTAVTKTTMALTPKAPAQLNAAEKAEYNLALELERLESADYKTLTDAQKRRLDNLQLMKPHKNFSYLNKYLLILAVCFVTLFYSAAGGLEAAFVTDLLQGLFIIVLSLLPLPFALMKINSMYGSTGVTGAFQTMHGQLPESYFEVFGSAHNVDFTWYYISAICILQVITVVATPNQLTAIASAKDEFAGRFGFVVGNFMKRFCTVMWGAFALAAALLYGKLVNDTDMVLGYATGDLLGPLHLGLPGLIIACLMAALMSSVSCWMICASGLLTQNFYRIILPRMSERHYVLIGRVAGSVILIGGTLMAMRMASILGQLKLLWEFPIVFAAPFWLGVLWRGATRTATWAAVAITLVLFFLLPVALPALYPALSTSPFLLQMTDARVIETAYTARAADVDQRRDEINAWDEASEEGTVTTARPAPLEVGQVFMKSQVVPRRSPFWTEGIKFNKNGVSQGRGRLNLEMAILAKMGVPLSKLPYALNETIRTLVRLFSPFLILIALSFLTKKGDKRVLDRFYVRMKTPVNVDHESDRREVEISYANPGRFDHTKIFPNTGIECCKWSRVDVAGFLVSWLGVIAVIVLFAVITSFGG